MGSLDQLLGAGLTALGALITVCGLNLMKFHNIQQQMNNKDTTVSPPIIHSKSKQKFSHYCTCSFLRGLIFFSIGQIIMIPGTYFATVSVCSATANIAVGFNALIAWKYFHERFNFFLPSQKKKLNVALPPPSSCRTRCQQVQEWDGLGVVCMLVGAALVVVGAPTLDDEHGVPMTFNETTELSLLFTRVDTIIVIYQKNMFAYVVRYYDLPLTTLTPPFCLFFYLFFLKYRQPLSVHIFFCKVVFGVGGLVTVICIFLICRRRRLGHHPREDDMTVSTNGVAISYGLLAGVMGGYTFLSMKLILVCGGPECTIQHVYVWFLLMCSGTFELMLVGSLNIGMSELKHSSVIIVSTYYVSTTIFSSIMGLVTFQLYSFMDVVSWCEFSTGMLLCLMGVSMVSSRDTSMQSDDINDVSNRLLEN